MYGADPVLTIQDSESTVANASAILRIGESDGSANLNNNFAIKFVGTASGGDLDFSRYNNTTIVNQGLRIKHDGNVGIGTTSPNSLLDVSAAAPIVTLNSTKDGSWTADETLGTINFRTSDSSGSGAGTIASIKAVAQDTTTLPNGSLVFSTGATSGFAERMRIDNDGLVGIGTTSPANNLTVAGDIGYTGYLGQGSIYGNAANASYARVQLYDPATGYTTFNNISYGYYFQTANSTKVTILNNGNVGIGASAPTSSKLHIIEADTGEGLRVDGASGGFAMIVEGGTSYKTRMRGGVTLGSGYVAVTPPANGLIVEGSVGIGIVSPTGGKLQVAGKVRIDAGSGNDALNLNAYDLLKWDGANLIHFGGYQSSQWQELHFYTNGAKALSIDASQKVGIGTNDPDTIFHVQGTSFSTFERNTSLTNVSRTAADFDHTTSGDMAAGFGSQIRFTGGDTGCSETTFAMLRGLRGSTDSEGEFSITAGTNGGEEFMRIDSSGNVGIGTTNPSTDFSVKEHLLFNDSTRLLTISNNTNTGGINLDGNNTRLYFSGCRALEGNNSGTTLTVGEGYGTTKISSVLNVVDHETILSPDNGSSSGVASRTLTIENINDSSWTTNALTAYNSTTSYDIRDRASYSFFARPTQGNILTYASETANNGTLHRFVNLNSSAIEPLYRWDFYQYDGSGTGTGDFKVPDKLFQIRVREGTSNVEKFTIDGNGNVGIGTGSPNRLLDITGASQNWNTAPAIQFTSTSTGGVNIRNWWVGPADTDYGNFHIFPSATRGGNPGSTSEAENGITIDYVGNVGIGNVSPGDQFSNANNLVIGTHSGDNGITICAGTSSEGGLYFADGASGADEYRGQIKYSHNLNDFVFAINAAEAMRLNSTGLGIGTTDPDEKLHVRGEQVYLYNDIDTNNTYFYARNSSSGNAGIKMKNSQGEWTIIANDRLRFYDDDNSIERFTILSSGNVGIGTAAPSRDLEVYRSGAVNFGLTAATSGIAAALFKGRSNVTNIATGPAQGGSNLSLYNLDTSDGNFNGVGFYNSNSLVTSGILGVNVSHSSRHGALVFQTHNGSSLLERMRIDKDGNVGIGITNPITKLNIKGDQSANGQLYIEPTNDSEYAGLVIKTTR